MIDTLAIVFDDILPSKGGVADYVCRFANELISRGVKVVFISVSCELTERSNRLVIEHLRLNRSDTFNEKKRQISEFLDLHEIENIFLQVVPYAFHPRGWMGGVTKLLPIDQRKRIVMFHEIWVGASLSAPWKHRMMGFIQKQGIRFFLNQLKPDKVFTSNSVYLNLIQKIGYPCQRLGLFGNIPIIENDSIGLRLDLNHLKGLFFGTLHLEWPPEPLFKNLLQYAKSISRSLEIISIGKIGAGIALWNRFRDKYGDDIQWTFVGEKEEDVISLYLQEVDFGIATTPWQNIGKSGTVIAMLEHGLPVIVNRNEIYDVATDDVIHQDPNLIQFTGKFEVLKKISNPKRSPKSLCENSVSEFLRNV